MLLFGAKLAWNGRSSFALSLAESPQMPGKAEDQGEALASEALALEVVVWRGEYQVDCPLPQYFACAKFVVVVPPRHSKCVDGEVDRTTAKFAAVEVR